MGLLSRLGIRLDNHTLGNLLKNVSPAAAFVPGVGLAGTAALSGLGDLARGKNIGQAAKGAVGNVAIGAGARGLSGHFGVLGQGGGDPLEAIKASQRTINGQVANGGGNAGAMASSLGVPAPSSGGGMLSSLAQPQQSRSMLSSVGGYAKAHPELALNAVSGIASGVGQAQGQNFERGQVTRQNTLDDEARRNRQAILNSILGAYAQGRG